MDSLAPSELRRNLVSTEPLRLDQAAGLLAAADMDEVFAWLPYARPPNIARAAAWIEDVLADRAADRRRRDGSWRDSFHYSILRSEWPDAEDRLLDRVAAAKAV